MSDASSKAALLLQETNTLFSLPEVCIRLRETLADPDSSRKEVADIIMLEPSLVTRVLRIVNSAYFGLSTTVKDISHALGILGESELNNLIMVTSIMQTMDSVDTEIDLKEFWKSSVYCAVLSRNLAAYCQLEAKAREEMFLAGLLFDIGKLPLYFSEPELLSEVKSKVIELDKKDYLVEREILGFNHSDVGSLMTKTWNFSDLMSETISAHHELDETKESSLECQIAYLTEHCRDNIDLNEQIEFDSEELGFSLPKEVKSLNISDQEFADILNRSQAEYLQAYQCFC